MEMTSIQIQIDNDLVPFLHGLNQPIEQAARELIVLELYRRGTISSGKAAELLLMSRLAFIQYTGRLGIPFFAMTDDEWDAEMRDIDEA
jgi:predicted HTH domain antitoxin